MSNTIVEIQSHIKVNKLLNSLVWVNTIGKLALFYFFWLSAISPTSCTNNKFYPSPKFRNNNSFANALKTYYYYSILAHTSTHPVNIYSVLCVCPKLYVSTSETAFLILSFLCHEHGKYCLIKSLWVFTSS